VHTFLPSQFIQISMDLVSSIVHGIPSLSRVHRPSLVGLLCVWKCPPPGVRVMSIAMGRKDMCWSNRGGERIQTKGCPDHPPPLFCAPFQGLLEWLQWRSTPLSLFVGRDMTVVGDNLTTFLLPYPHFSIILLYSSPSGHSALLLATAYCPP
jgi:hypothetical protein